MKQMHTRDRDCDFDGNENHEDDDLSPYIFGIKFHYANWILLFLAMGSANGCTKVCTKICMDFIVLEMGLAKDLFLELCNVSNMNSLCSLISNFV